MVKIRNNEPRLYVLPPVIQFGGVMQLVPGVNEIDEEYWNEISKRKDVQALLEQDAEGTPDRKVLEVVTSGKPLIPKNVKTTLADMPVQNAIELIKDADESLLNTWAQNEKRNDVQIAIGNRLVQLRDAKKAK